MKDRQFRSHGNNFRVHPGIELPELGAEFLAQFLRTFAGYQGIVCAVIRWRRGRSRFGRRFPVHGVQQVRLSLAHRHISGSITAGQREAVPLPIRCGFLVSGFLLRCFLLRGFFVSHLPGFEFGRRVAGQERGVSGFRIQQGFGFGFGLPFFIGVLR